MPATRYYTTANDGRPGQILEGGVSLHPFPSPTRCTFVNNALSIWRLHTMEETIEEYFSLGSQHFDRDNETSPFDTLWTEFARSHPRLSPPRTPVRPGARRTPSVEGTRGPARPAVDLRALECVTDYDSNLMCPICHVPFIEPVVLDCDHTFCGDCFGEYRNGGPSTDRSRCPSCRSYHLGGSRKASRLIKNMCNDIQVRCPNDGCGSAMARGCVIQHVTKECPEYYLPCPNLECDKQTKRKNFVPEQCIHASHIECECGASVRLGRGEWIKHKDQDCPLSQDAALDASSSETPAIQIKCPGSEYGCIDTVDPDTMDVHTITCPLARLAPHLKKQSLLLTSLQEQLTMAKIRNEVLETGFDRLNELIANTIQPKLSQLDNDTASVSSIEEIPRDLSTLPGHSQDLGVPTSTLHHHEHQLNTNVYPRLSSLETHVGSLESQLTDLDARSSMALMNETLRIREELAHINGAMYSTRAQVQWLLNRERIMGQRDAMAAGPAARGRVGANISNAGQPSATTNTESSGSEGQGQQRANTNTREQRPSIDRNMTSAWSTSQASAGVGSLPSSTATSPIFGASRPSIRRPSGGGSQERVKL